jgi:hypothetical protein
VEHPRPLSLWRCFYRPLSVAGESGSRLQCDTYSMSLQWGQLKRICNSARHTGFMMQGPAWEVSSCTANQEIPDHTPFFPTLHFNIILPDTPKSSKWLHPSAFPTEDLNASIFPSSACYMVRPNHPLLLEHLNYILWEAEIMKSLTKRYKYYHQHRKKRLLNSVCPSVTMK